MAICPKCSKPVTEGAAHCGYCGNKLSPPIAEKKTVFGYAAMKMPAASQPEPQPRQQPAAQPRPQPQPTPAAQPAQPQPRPAPQAVAPAHAAPAAPPPEDAMAKTQFATPPAPAPVQPTHTSQDGLPAPASLRRSQPYPAAAPAHQPPAAAAAAAVPPTVVSDAVTPSPAAIPPTMFAAAAPVVAAPAEPPAAAVEPAAKKEPPPKPKKEPKPKKAPKPLLASESLEADRAPVEPGKGAMRVLMILGGLLLAGLFCAPFSGAGDKLLFSWDLLKGQEGIQFISTIYLAAGGVIFIAAGLLPLPYIIRAMTATLFALAPIGIAMAGVGAEWRALALFVIVVLLPAALFHRARYRSSILARILVGLGVLGVLATLLIPIGSSVPLVQVFDGLGSVSAEQAIPKLLPLVLLLLAVLSLLAFLPSSMTGLTGIWAVLVILYLPVVAWYQAMLQTSPSHIFQTLHTFYPGLALLIYVMLASFGLSQVFAKIAKPS
jgi:hypothetical protein